MCSAKYAILYLAKTFSQNYFQGKGYSWKKKKKNQRVMSYIISVRKGIFITLSKPASYSMCDQHLPSTWRMYEGRVFSVFSELTAHERKHNNIVLNQEIGVIKATTVQMSLLLQCT